MLFQQGWTRFAAASSIIVLAVVAACERPAGTPAPSFERIDGASRSAVLSYAQALSFDTARGAGDEQVLPLLDSTRAVVPGPVVRIEPERGAAYLTRAQLAQGRIIARFRAAAAYEPLGLPAGMSYLWADSIEGEFRHVVIPENEGESLSVFPLEIEEHGPGYFGRPSARGARWFVMSDSVGCWAPCLAGCCCRKQMALSDLLATPPRRIGPLR